MASCHRVVMPLLTVFAVVGLSATARAQEPAPPANSWAVEGGVGNDNSASLLKFRSQSSAWLLSFDGSFGTSKTEGVVGSTDRFTQYQVNGRLGLRNYRDREGDVRPFTSYGVLAGIGHSSGGTQSDLSWNAGAFLEFGGNYMLSPHFSLGGAGEMSARYMRLSTTNDDTVLGELKIHNDAIIASIGRIRFLATVYF